MAKLCVLGKSMDNWIVLFVRTGTEEKLLSILKSKLDTREYMPFIPSKEVPYRNKGVIKKLNKMLFPGYLFIKTQVEQNRIADKLSIALRGLNGIYSILHYGNDKNNVALKPQERLYIEQLLNDDFVATGSVGLIEGDEVKIISGPMTGLESRIKKINRHKRQAVIEMDIMGASREVVLMLEVIEKHKSL